MRSQLPQFDTLTQIMGIRHIRRKKHNDILRLLDYMTDSSPAVVHAARESLFALVPMASLTERWADDSDLENPRNPNFPVWLWSLCEGWGQAGDFVDLCVQKACSLNPEKSELFLNQLATFQGLERMFVKRLEQRNLSALAESFKNKVKTLRSKQFPKQLTIAPTLACQLTCSYCVSAGTNPEQENEITLPNALQILDWARKNDVERIGLTGGEPTLYSHFSHLLKKISESGFKLYLATNGLGPPESMQAIASARPLCVTMHLAPQTLTSESVHTYKRNASFLIHEGIYVAMRCNFADPADNVSSYFDVAEGAGIVEIRTAIPIPNAKRHNQYVSSTSLKKFGSLLAAFVAEGKRRGVSTKLAKPFFPCKLSLETAQTFFSNGSMSINCPVHLLDFSNNLIVYPNGSFIPCLGLSVNSRQHILRFKDTQDAASIFTNQLMKLIKQPLLEECQVCPLWKGGRCVGACLSYRLPPQYNDHRIDGG